MKIVGIVQARMGSTRLPGKVLRTLHGSSMLARSIRAAQESMSLDELVVATSTDAEDEAIVKECDRLGVASVRGPVDDVLTRFVMALDASPGDAVMRFTADNPLQDPAIISLVAQIFRAAPGADYLSTGLTRSLPHGMDVEVISAEALRMLDKLATDYHRTHVTSYAYTNPHDFTVLGLSFLPNCSHLRVTLDTPEDWHLVEAVITHFGDRSVPWLQLAEWIESHPEVRALNAVVRQRELNEA